MAWTSPRTWSTSEVVTAAHMNTHVRDNLDALNPLDSVGATSWSPTLKGSTADDPGGSASGAYWRVGPMLRAMVRLVVGTGGSPGLQGTFFVTLPVAASGLTGSDAAANTGQVVGSFRAVDSGTSANNQGGQVTLGSALTVVRFALGDAGGNLVTHTNPFTWTTGDVLSFEVEYPVA